MKTSTFKNRQTIKSLQQSNLTDDDTILNFNSESEPSFSQNTKREIQYTSTNLLTSNIISVDQVIVQTKSIEQIKCKVSDFVNQKNRIDIQQLFIDPKKTIQKAINYNGNLSMFEESQIQDVGQQALDLYTQFQVEKQQIYNENKQQVIVDFSKLNSKILQDHKKQVEFTNKKTIKKLQFGNTRIKEYLNKQNEKDIQYHKYLSQSVQDLYFNKCFTQKLISRKLKISLKKVQEILKIVKLRGKVQQCTFNKKKSFKKIHQRARDYIADYVSKQKILIQIPQLQKDILQNIQLKLSHTMIRRYLKQELGLKYKIVKQITLNHNKIQNKLQRQYTAFEYVQFLQQKKRIINIDETLLSTTDSRKKGWIGGYSRNIVTHSQRMNQVSMICAIADSGDLYYTLNYGKTCSITFQFFLCKLIQKLDEEDLMWRQNTIFIIDNAPYHRGQESIKFYQHLKIPLMFLGPYSYKLAPVELFFSFIKNRDLNPLKYRATTKKQVSYFMKEFAVLISKLDISFIEKLFYFVLQGALDFLSLTDL